MTDFEVGQDFSARKGEIAPFDIGERIMHQARECARDGIVLLRNVDDLLPLAPSTKVAVYGRCQFDWMSVGYGSGGDFVPAYTTNLTDSLVETELEVDTELADQYRAWCADNPPEEGAWGTWPLSYPEMPLDDEAITAAASRTDVGIVVIGRASGEDRDVERKPGSFYLTDDERSLIDRVRGAHQKVVVIVTTGNVIDLGWADDDIDAVMIAWLGGMEGGRAAADVVAGRGEPGGRLTTTIARTYDSYPPFTEFGDPDIARYVEDIYVGYRWFETFDAGDVLFPFGFGLGYTNFDVKGDVSADSDAVTVTATASNRGERPGRTVVQVYAGGPATDTGRPARSLVGFARTPEIGPGCDSEITVEFSVRDLAIFDDAGTTGHRNAWVVEPGEYPIYVGTDIRQATEVGRVTIDDLVVVEELEEVAAPTVEFERAVAKPTPDGVRLAYQPVPQRESDLRQRILDRLPDEIVGGDQPITDFDEVIDGTASLDDFVASLSTERLTELTFGAGGPDDPHGPAGNVGILAGVTDELRALGVPAITTTDGPSGIRLRSVGSQLPCGIALASSWDPDAVRNLYSLLGEECRAKGSDILLAPGLNIHRSPLCGRNFEYFSEDPLISGVFAAALVEGVQSQGVAACPKHFAANNQEHNRINNDSQVSQRALREIYLRGFRIVVETAEPWTVMTSYNKVNGVWSHYNYDLATTVLRGEWDYDGMVMTDWWMQPSPDPDFDGIADSGYRVRAQVDVLMPGDTDLRPTDSTDRIADSLQAGLTRAELQRSARHVLGLVMRLRSQE